MVLNISSSIALHCIAIQIVVCTFFLHTPLRTSIRRALSPVCCHHFVAFVVFWRSIFFRPDFINEMHVVYVSCKFSPLFPFPLVCCMHVVQLIDNRNGINLSKSTVNNMKSKHLTDSMISNLCLHFEIYHKREHYTIFRWFILHRKDIERKSTATTSVAWVWPIKKNRWKSIKIAVRIELLLADWGNSTELNANSIRTFGEPNCLYWARFIFGFKVFHRDFSQNTMSYSAISPFYTHGHWHSIVFKTFQQFWNFNGLLFLSPFLVIA